jgi:hypothetical protein
MSILVAVRSNAHGCSSFTDGIAGSNPVEGMDVPFLVFAVSCVCSDLCDQLITRSGGVLPGSCVCV